MSCPVTIHKVTDSSPYESGEKARCPISTLDIDDITDSPTVQEYKRLRRVMGMITKFYRQGSDKKRDNWNIVTEEMSKVDLDLTMAQAQLDVLTQSAFKGHPKQSEYAKNLKAEIEALEKQKSTYTSQQKEFFELYEWSKGIVQVCEWLEMALDDYCSKKMELPENLMKHIKTPPELKPEEIEKFSKGLDEITYNLQESQDFFQASIDGRLVKYHDIEKKLIEEQLEILKKFPEDSPRRAYIEMELQKDLEYVQGNMNETPESMNRKQKMLTNHQEFFSVLRFIREKIHLLPAPVEKKYDSKYDHYQ